MPSAPTSSQMLLKPRAVTAFVYALVVMSLKIIDGTLYLGEQEKQSNGKLKLRASLQELSIRRFLAPWRGLHFVASTKVWLYCHLTRRVSSVYQFWQIVTSQFAVLSEQWWHPAWYCSDVAHLLWGCTCAFTDGLRTSVVMSEYWS